MKCPPRSIQNSILTSDVIHTHACLLPAAAHRYRCFRALIHVAPIHPPFDYSFPTLYVQPVGEITMSVLMCVLHQKRSNQTIDPPRFLNLYYQHKSHRWALSIRLGSDPNDGNSWGRVIFLVQDHILSLLTGDRRPILDALGQLVCSPWPSRYNPKHGPPFISEDDARRTLAPIEEET
ncbi:hypothetical protein BD779DRAFT_927151 [Infundibulicybe gibba]|nr:hypothetical protein BD779DRAFT_927151 [Infundibulicybe gibba]